MEKIGVIVGTGRLPLHFINEAKGERFQLYPIGLFDTIEPEIKEHPNYRFFNIGSVGEISTYLIKNDIKKVIMLGKVEKELVFKNLQLDTIGEELLEKLPDRKDETLLFGIIVFFRLNGIKVLPQNYLLKSFIFEKKCYTDSKPTEEELKTIKIGIEAATSLSKVDAGQSVICKNSAVIALEGIEGTDKTIKRGGELGGPGTILVKMARPQQDMRVDIPAIGVGTIESLIAIGARGLVAQSGKMLFIEKEKCIELANKNGMFILGR